MNETMKNITERNSCRDFAGAPLTDGQLEAIATAALAAPSAMNRQPWHVILVKDKALIDELDTEGMGILAASEDKTVHSRMMERGGKLLYNAPCLAVILSDGSAWAAVDCGILCQNVVLAAQSLGLGSCIVGMAGVPLGGARGDEFKKRLKFPDGYVFQVGVLIGNVSTGKEPHELDRSKLTYV